MDKNIYGFLDYKAYLLYSMKQRPAAGRGFRTQIAEAAQCQPTFVTQVLSGHSHFSPEQAIMVSSILNHTQDEKEFFLLLIQYNRAGTSVLKEHFRNEIRNRVNAQLDLKKRLDSPQTLSFEQQASYYSAWFHSALRVALGVPELRTVSALSVRFKISESTVRESLEFLVACGMVVKQGDKYSGNPHHMHLGNDSALLNRLHTNWRVKTLSSLQEEGPSDLHYSYVMTISREDAIEVKSLLVNYIKELQGKVQPSKDETVCALCSRFLRTLKLFGVLLAGMSAV